MTPEKYITNRDISDKYRNPVKPGYADICKSCPSYSRIKKKLGLEACRVTRVCNPTIYVTDYGVQICTGRNLKLNSRETEKDLKSGDEFGEESKDCPLIKSKKRSFEKRQYDLKVHLGDYIVK